MQVDLNNLRVSSRQRPLAALGSESLSWSDLTAVCQPGSQRELSLVVLFLLGTVPKRQDGSIRGRSGLFVARPLDEKVACRFDGSVSACSQIWVSVMEGYRADFV